MLLSVSVWSGAEPGDARPVPLDLGADRAAGARLFGPGLLPLGLAGLRHGRTNMDVPISIGVLLAFGMSLYDTIHHGPHAYFDAAISLLFFLLIGRTLDHMMRERARAAVKGLARLAARGALVRAARRRAATTCRSSEIEPGMTILLAAGERVPVDARVVERAIGPRLLPGVGRERAAARAPERHRPAGRHAQPHRPADDRRDGGRQGLLPRRDGAADGGGRGRPLGLSPHRRPRRAALCAGGPSARRC